MSILLKKLLGGTVRWAWTAIFGSAVILAILSKITDAETIQQIKDIGSDNGLVANALWTAILGLAPLFWSWYAKVVEVVKRWVAAHMPPSSLPATEAEYKSAVGKNPITNIKIATGTAYPTTVNRGAKP